MKIERLAPDLHSIALDQELPGFGDFIHAWLYTGGPVLLVDPGPAATIPRLLEALASLSARPDFILLTHVHLDHSGGAGDLVKALGPVPVVGHAKAAPHLADPSLLWEGSLKTLGDKARAYGRPRPVDPALFRDAATAAVPGVRTIPTPGHAPHHVSFLAGPCLFAGEAAGVRIPLAQGGCLIRPATPPRFFYETTLASLRALMNTPHRFLCYGHAGMSTHTPQNLTAHEAQLARWRSVIRGVKENAPQDPVAESLALLLAQDPLLAGFPTLPEGTRARERFFLENSIRGFLGEG